MSLLAQNEKLARRVGAATLLVLALAIGFFVFLAPDIDWGARTRVEVYFRHTGELREGAPVILAGREIGTVEAIRIAPRGAIAVPSGCTALPTLDEGGVVVTLDLSRASARHVVFLESGRTPGGGDVFIAGRGPLSARHVELAPAATPDGPSLAERPCPMRGADPPTLDRVVQRTWDNLVNAKRFADEVAPEFRALRAELVQLASTLDNLVPNVVGVASLGYQLDGLLAEAKQLRAALGGDAGLANIDAVLARARATIAKARTMLDALDGKATALVTAVDGVRGRLGERGPAAVKAVETAIARLRAAIDKIDPLLAKVEDINRRIAAGEGTIGRLARDPEFPEDAKELGKILKRQPWRIFMRPKDN